MDISKLFYKFASHKNFDTMKKSYTELPFFMNTKSKYRCLVMRIAHSIKKNDFSFSEAQKKAWKVVDLIGRLYTSTENIDFTFVKKTGEIRPANGTRNHRIIPRKFIPKYINPSKINIKAIPYFDIEKGAWRAFKPYLLIAS